MQPHPVSDPSHTLCVQGYEYAAIFDADFDPPTDFLEEVGQEAATVWPRAPPSPELAESVFFRSSRFFDPKTDSDSYLDP